MSDAKIAHVILYTIHNNSLRCSPTVKAAELRPTDILRHIFGTD